MLRRQLGLSCIAGGIAWLVAPGRAAAADARFVAAESGPLGTVFELRPKAAAFPAPGGKYDDPTTLVFVPATFRLPKSGAVDVVVHFHGHNTTAKKAIAAHRLCEQLVASKQNAVLVVPQGAVNAADGDFGKLMRKGGLRNLLGEVRALVAARTPGEKDSSLAGSKKVRRVVLSAHSGGYRAAAACARGAGLDVSEIYLFDALYGDVDTFARWALRADDHKIVSYSVGGVPRENSNKLAATLEAKGVDVVRESGQRLTREELVHGRAVFLEGHTSHASATYEEQALRDCLLASCLTGRGSRAWHDGKKLPRAS